MNYQPKMVPRDYQLEALERMRGRAVFALLMAMRTGKTKVALDDYGRLELANQIKDLLVIAPAVVYRTWETAIREHVSDDLQKRVQIYTWISGKSNKHDRLKDFLTHEGPRIFLVNVEALSSSSTGARLACERFVSMKCMIVV